MGALRSTRVPPMDYVDDPLPPQSPVPISLSQQRIPIDGAVINLEVEFLMSKWAEFRASAQAAYASAHADMRDMAHKGLSPETDPGQSTARIDEWAFLRSKKS